MNAPPITREQQRKLTRRRIIDAARTCFYERGVADVSAEQIARAAKVSRATLYLHFPNKDAILLELLSLNLGGVKRIFAEFCTQSAHDLQAIKLWLQRYTDMLRANRDAMRLVHIGIATTDAASHLIHAHRLALTGMLRERFPNIGGSGRDDAWLLLVLARIDHLAGAAAESPPQIDLAEGSDMVGRELLSLIAAS